MIGICQKCHKVDVPIITTSVILSEIGTVKIPLCSDCRKNKN